MVHAPIWSSIFLLRFSSTKLKEQECNLVRLSFKSNLDLMFNERRKFIVTRKRKCSVVK